MPVTPAGYPLSSRSSRSQRTPLAPLAPAGPLAPLEPHVHRAVVPARELPAPLDARRRCAAPPPRRASAAGVGSSRTLSRPDLCRRCRAQRPGLHPCPAQAHLAPRRAGSTRSGTNGIHHGGAVASSRYRHHQSSPVRRGRPTRRRRRRGGLRGVPRLGAVDARGRAGPRPGARCPRPGSRPRRGRTPRARAPARRACRPAYGGDEQPRRRGGRSPISSPVSSNSRQARAAPPVRSRSAWAVDGTGVRPPNVSMTSTLASSVSDPTGTVTGTTNQSSL